MCGAGRALRWRGAEEDGDLARPESPSRCTLPITALRVIPPSSPAIWLSVSPAAQSFLSSSTRSSVQDMSLYPLSEMPVPLAESALADRRQAGLGSLTLQNTGNCSLRHVVLNGGDATIWRDSGARVGATHFHIFLLLRLVNPQKSVGTVVFMSWRAGGAVLWTAMAGGGRARDNRGVSPPGPGKKKIQP